MDKIQILGVKIDQVSENQAVELVSSWVKKGGKYYIVTPNVEFLMAAQKDPEFRKILNNANLSIPDSARFNWAVHQISLTNYIKRLLFWPFFLYPKASFLDHFPTTTGTDLMEKLIAKSIEQAFTVGLLGGQKGVALKLAERLKKTYPKLKISYVSEGGEVDKDGNMAIHGLGVITADILFVAFGQVKQEKWIDKNLGKSKVKVMMGVGGAFDYLSGSVSRAPVWMRGLGLEWLYRFLTQPWRIKRFVNLVRFVFLMI